MKLGDTREKRLSLSMPKEFLKSINNEQSYGAPLAHDSERKIEL